MIGVILDLFKSDEKRYEELVVYSEYDLPAAFDIIRKTAYKAQIKNLEKEYYYWIGLAMYFENSGEPVSDSDKTKNKAFFEKARKKILSIAKKLYKNQNQK